MISLLLWMATPALFAQAPVNLSPIPVTVATPAGWKLAGAEDGNAVFVPSQSPQSMVIFHGGIYETLEHLANAGGVMVKDLKFSGQPKVVDGPREETIAGMPGFTMTLSGVNPQGQPVVVHVMGALSAGNIGVGLLALAPAADSEAVRAVSTQLIRGARLGSLAANRDAAVALQGTWVRSRAKTSGNTASAAGGWSDSSSANYVFQQDGRYRFHSRSMVSVSAGEASSYSNSEHSDEGRFFVVNGKLILTSAKSGSRVVSLSAAGARIQIGAETYLRQ